MNKRLPLLFSLLAVIALSASIAYWVMALYKPQQRPLAAMAEATTPDPVPEAAASLFGGQVVSVVASNYQLTGVVAAGRDSVAILVADGKPPRALQLGKEFADGVVVREIHPKYVMLSEGGVLKRIELATDATAGTSLALAGPTVLNPQQQQMQQQMQAQQGPPVQPPQPEPQYNNVPVPPNQPMEVPQALPPGVPPPPPSMNMPAPTRNMSGQGGQPPTQ